MPNIIDDLYDTAHTKACSDAPGADDCPTSIGSGIDAGVEAVTAYKDRVPADQFSKELLASTFFETHFTHPMCVKLVASLLRALAA